ncbi:ion channel [Rhodopseudomonas sp. B29]|uniref:ion channel n=1 Tax=Rhodopseudomonas sp. B29 TaxID=95607 RepID=UPI000345BAD9|nr:ion channel [Rhodopseudomonas sp. B29]
MHNQSRSASRRNVLRLGSHEIVTEGLELSFWADMSHRCMTASWPAFVAGAATLFLIFNALFATLYWIGDNPVANVPGGAYVDYLYFSIETLSTAGYGDMHPQTHYGHFIATVELFTGIFSMSLMTGLIFARFSRPKARLLFADHPVISVHDGKPTLTIRFANERSDLITGATARLWLIRTESRSESPNFRRFVELPLISNESPVLALSWTLFHSIDETSPLHGMTPEAVRAHTAFIVLIGGYDENAAQALHASKSYSGRDVHFGHRYADIVRDEGQGRIRIDYGKFHQTEPE